MKIGIYSARPDEEEFFVPAQEKYQVDLQLIPADPVPETVEAAAGCDCISILTKTMITPEMLEGYHRLGVRFISTRTVGYEHIDVGYAKELGMGVGNVSYTPYSVAEYTVMMMLMSLRQVKTIAIRSLGQDYGLEKIRGRLINQRTVGLIGTGKIGATVAQLLSGFGCEILAYDKYQNPDLEGLVTYVPMEQLLADSDIVSLHVPYSQDNHHMMNSQTFGLMKQGAIFVNTARGELVDSEALITAMEEGHLGGAALDLIEGDRLIYYRDKKLEQLKNRHMAILNGLPNVIMMPHMAFFTDRSVQDMVEMSIRTCKEYIDAQG